MLNRQQRRNFAKTYRKKLTGLGLPEEMKKAYIEYKLQNIFAESLKAGEKVRLNYDEIVKHPDYIGKTAGYKESIEALKDIECTVEYDEKYKKNPYFVCLKEDTHNPKWLFAKTDLIKVENEQNSEQEGQEGDKNNE